MVDESVVVALVVGLVSAVVGVLLGYAFALRAARRQRRHEIKEGVYGRMFPKIQESIDILGEIQTVVGLELQKDETSEALVERLSQPLWVLGLTDAVTEMRGYLSDPAGNKQPPELFAKIQKAVFTWLFSEVYRSLRDLRYDLAALELTPPSPEVKAKLDTALGTILVSMFGQDKGSEFLWSVLRLTKGWGPLLSKYDFKTHAEAPKKALEELRIAMKEDLRRTLSLGRQ